MRTSFRTVTADGVDVSCREAGPQDAPVMLLVHGFPSSSPMFRDLIPLLADTYRVIAPDLPGFGFTVVPDARGYVYTFDNLATTLEAEKYPLFQQFVRDTQVPTLAIWGRNDPFFIPPGAEAYRRDNPNATVRLLDTGHFALETHVDEIALEIRALLERAVG